jgi:MraZ protein
MLLTGNFLRVLDDKQRLAIPRRMRDALGLSANPVVYLAPGTDGSLALYPEETFSRLAMQLDQGSPTRADVRAFSRLFYAQAQCVEIDRQGRLRIPQELFQLASLSKEIVLLGVRDHIEIWDAQRWNEYLAQQQQQYDQIAETAFCASSQSSANAANVMGNKLSEAETRPARPR